MTKEKNDSSAVLGNHPWEEDERKAQEDFREELNEKLLAGLSDMLNPQNENSSSGSIESEMTEDQTIVSKRENQQNSSKQNAGKQNTGLQSTVVKGKNKKVKTSKKRTASAKRMNSVLKIVLTSLLAVLLVLIILAACAMGIYCKGKNHMISSAGMKFQIPEGVTATSDNNGRTVSYENKDYRYRTGTTNILLIGKNPDHTFSTVVVNFDEKSKIFRFMPVPADLLVIDYSSSMNYSDIADYVSEFLCGLPLQGYMVLDMRAVDSILETGTDQVTDSIQMQKLTAFVEELTDNASDNWMIPMHVFEKLQESFGTNLGLAELSYMYRLFIVCDNSLEYEFVQPTDMEMVFQQFLSVFCDEKQK